MTFEFELFWEALTSEAYLTGAFIAVSLSVLVMATSIALGLVIATFRRSKSSVLKAGAGVYIWIFRAIPVLLILLVTWNALPQVIPIFASPWFTAFMAAYLGLTLTEAAITSEILRSAMTAVDDGQRLAAKVLGFSSRQSMIKIVIPQMIRIALPPLGNQFIIMIKLTSLASVISLRELLAVSQGEVSRTFRYAEYYGAAAVYYLVIVSLFMLIQLKLEQKYTWKSTRKSSMMVDQTRISAREGA